MRIVPSPASALGVASRRVASRRRRWHGEEGEEEEEEEVEVHLERLDGGRGPPPKAKCFVPRGRHHVSRVIFHRR